MGCVFAWYTSRNDQKLHWRVQNVALAGNGAKAGSNLSALFILFWKRDSMKAAVAATMVSVQFCENRGQFYVRFLVKLVIEFFSENFEFTRQDKS